MSDVFISYSREDGAFVRRLHDALEAAGRESWVDWEGIPPTAEWMAEIHQAIEAADTFVAVLSPTSVGSEVCRAEVAFAAAQGKRLVPLVVEEVDPQETPSELARLNWLFFRKEDDFDQAFAKLIEALDTDLDHLKLHTWLMVRCGRWARGGEDESSLLRGGELATAESWLAASADKQPAPTAAQSRFILESRRRETRRQRRLLAGVALALIVSIFLGALAWVQRNRAETQRKLAVARALATRSELELDGTGDGLVRSALLAAESLALVQTQEGNASWRRAMRLLPPAPVVRSAALGETKAGAVSDDERLWAAGSGDGLVTVGELESGEIVRQWQAVETPVESLAFDLDLGVLAVGGRQVLTIWSLGDGSKLAEVREEDLRLDTFGRVHDLAFSHDHARLYAAAEGYGVEVFSTESWRRLEPLETPESRAFGLALHPAREWLVAGGFGLTLLEPRSRRARRVQDDREEEVDALTFSREGDLLGTVDFAVRVWDVGEGDDGLPEARLADSLARADDRALSVDFSPGGRYLAVARETGVVHVRSAKTGAEVDRIVEPQPVTHVRMVDDGSKIATLSDRLRVRAAITGEEIRRTALDAEIEDAFLVGSDGWVIATSRDGRMRTFAAADLAPRSSFELGREPETAVSPDRRWLAAAGGDQLFLLNTATLEAPSGLEFPDSFRSPALLFDESSRFLVVSGLGHAWVLDLESLLWSRLFSEEERPRRWQPALTAEGAWLVLDSLGATRLFRPEVWSGSEELKGKLQAFEPGGERVCTLQEPRRGAHMGIQVVWDPRTGEELGSIGLAAYQGRSAEDFGAGDLELARRCETWPEVELIEENPRPGAGGAKRRVEADGGSLLLFAVQAGDRIAETCRRVPRQLTPEEWQRLMPGEEFRPTCPGVS